MARRHRVRHTPTPAYSGSAATTAILPNATATGADFSNCNLRETVWTEAELTGANFSQADLQYADMSYTILDRATFAGANLLRTNLHGVLEQGTQWRGANRSLARGTDEDRFRGERGFQPPPAATSTNEVKS